MAELNTKLHCKKDGVTEEITAYTTLDEVQNQGINIKVDGFNAYVKYGDSGDANASQLNCKMPNDNTEYKVIKEASSSVSVILCCFDVATEQQISAISYPCPADGVLYLNNENAPSIAGYDFVVMDGIKHTGVREDDVFYVWYVAQSIPDRTKTLWTQYFPATTTEALANTYSATNLAMLCYNCSSLDKVHRLNTSNVTTMQHTFSGCTSLTSVPAMDTSNVTNMQNMFYNCSSLTSVPAMDTSNVTAMRNMFYNCSLLTSVPEINPSNVTNMSYVFYNCSSLTSVPAMDTSNVTDMQRMFSGCTSLTSVPAMDTSNVANMSQLFDGCTSLTSVDWDIDMSSCTNCLYMFRGCPTTNIRLKNVPNGLSLRNIGTTNYTVVNYI